jgi:tripartite-type tricarboxylate transporter receptor subunit TctC
LIVPAGTPKSVIARLNSEFARIVRIPEVTERLMQVLDAEPIGSSPHEFQAFLSAETDRWGQIIQAANIKPRG